LTISNASSSSIALATAALIRSTLTGTPGTEIKNGLTRNVGLIDPAIRFTRSQTQAGRSEGHRKWGHASLRYTPQAEPAPSVVAIKLHRHASSARIGGAAT
jgi:hypothetical protein